MKKETPSIKTTLIMISVSVWLVVAAIIAGVLMKNSSVGLDVNCARPSFNGMVSITGTVVFEREDDYLVKGHYEFRQASEDGTSLEVETWYNNASPFKKADCIRKREPERYIDILNRFEEEGSLYY